MKNIYVYIMSNKPDGTLYIGVTNDLCRRVYEHKNKLIEGFTKRYNLNILVYYEVFDSEIQAIQREKNLKHYTRQWKLSLINDKNPEWKDLYDSIQ